MKLTITMIVLMWSIPPFIAWWWQCACYVSTRYNCNGLSCTLRLPKDEHRMLWRLLTPAWVSSCSPTQWMVFVIQQKSVCSTNEKKLLFIMRSMLRVSTSESMIPRPCFQYCKHRLLTVLLHVYSLPYFIQIAITTHIHPYYLYFTISSPN